MTCRTLLLSVVFLANVLISLDGQKTRRDKRETTNSPDEKCHGFETGDLCNKYCPTLIRYCEECETTVNIIHYNCQLDIKFPIISFSLFVIIFMCNFAIVVFLRRMKYKRIMTESRLESFADSEPLSTYEESESKSMSSAAPSLKASAWSESLGGKRKKIDEGATDEEAKEMLKKRIQLSTNTSPLPSWSNSSEVKSAPIEVCIRKKQEKKTEPTDSTAGTTSTTKFEQSHRSGATESLKTLSTQGSTSSSASQSAPEETWIIGGVY